MLLSSPSVLPRPSPQRPTSASAAHLPSTKSRGFTLIFSTRWYEGLGICIIQLDLLLVRCWIYLAIEHEDLELCSFWSIAPCAWWFRSILLGVHKSNTHLWVVEWPGFLSILPCVCARDEVVKWFSFYFLNFDSFNFSLSLSTPLPPWQSYHNITHIPTQSILYSTIFWSACICYFTVICHWLMYRAETSRHFIMWGIAVIMLFKFKMSQRLS